jgi:hypothetical protein
MSTVLNSAGHSSSNVSEEKRSFSGSDHNKFTQPLVPAGSGNSQCLQSYKEMLQTMKKAQAVLDELQDQALELQGKTFLWLCKCKIQGLILMPFDSFNSL